jgi:hypothetical protein
VVERQRTIEIVNDWAVRAEAERPTSEADASIVALVRYIRTSVAVTISGRKVDAILAVIRMGVQGRSGS